MFDRIKNQLTLENIVLLVAMLLALSWAWSTVNVLTRNYDLERQVQQADLDNQVVKLQNENLKLEQAYFQTDEYLELQARKLLNKAEPGEHLVILPRTEESGSSLNSSRVSNVSKSNFEQWMDFLFGRGS
jgi:cell division protein FtsB